MKISITYLFAIFKYGYPPDPKDDFKALADIEKMGFHFLEMEGLGGEHTEGIWQQRLDLKKCLDDHGIHVHNFCGVDPNLVSLDDSVRRGAYESFKRTAELGAFLGAETLHLASYAPPVDYVENSPYKLGADYSFGDTFRLRIPEGFSWQRVWKVLVESCRFTAQTAAQHGRTIIMEPRIGEIICSPDSMLRLIADVDMPNFKANFDTGHFSAQRENVVLALSKLEGHFANIHVSDNNPVDTNHLAIGDGTIDWHEFLRVLQQMEYSGYLGLDLGTSSSLEQDYHRSVSHLKRIGDELGIVFET